MLIRGSPLRAVTTSGHKIQDSPFLIDAIDDPAAFGAAFGVTSVAA
jgi:hypothetical protein